MQNYHILTKCQTIRPHICPWWVITQAHIQNMDMTIIQLNIVFSSKCPQLLINVECELYVHHIFEPCMDTLIAKYKEVWNYDTNLKFPLFGKGNSTRVPMDSTYTPDGGVSGVTMDLNLAVEIAWSK